MWWRSRCNIVEWDLTAEPSRAAKPREISPAREPWFFECRPLLSPYLIPVKSANQRETCKLKFPIIFARDSLEISVDRLDTTPQLVIMWNVTLWVCLNRSFFYFLGSRAKVTSTTQCMYHSKLWLSKSFFATLGLTLKGHEAGLLHAYWVTISCGLFFCRCSW